MSIGQYGSAFDPAGSWASKLRGSEHFPSPFLDMASLAMPESGSTALQWCEYIFQSNGTYRQAMERVIAYFITDVDIGTTNASYTVSDDEKEKWESFLGETLDILPFVQALDRDNICYGNSFASLIVPFKRNLTCPKCYTMLPLPVVYEDPKFAFSFSGWEFIAKCPRCSYRGAWKVTDEPQPIANKLRLKRWSPHEMKLLHDPLTEDIHYLWKIPEDYKRQIREGRLFHLERVSKPVLEAIKHNQLFRFAPGAIFHMKEPTLAGTQNRGWGLSRLISNFRQVWYVQVLHRYNEAIALDYVIPFRLITPAPRGGSTPGSQDPLLSANMGDFMGQVRNIIRRRRRDPAEWHTLPFAVEYQSIGGDANALAPKELLDQAHETLLNAAGTPVELYRGSMQLQTAPVSLRLFEATWHHQVHSNNSFLRWLVNRVAEVLSWDKVTARHKRVTHADDMQRHMALLQLMMGGTISQTTGLRNLGIDFADELRLLAEEARKQQDVEREVQKEQDTQMRGDEIAMGGGMPAGGMPPGGAPMPPGGGQVDPATGMPIPQPVTSMIQNNVMPQTPEDMLSQAESLAQQLLGLPEAQKDSELRALKQKNPVLHDLVLAALKRIRYRYSSQGKSMLMQQDFGG